jgi:hypothetical protein
MEKKKRENPGSKTTQIEYTKKNLENIFMSTLFEYLGKDLSSLYLRRKNFFRGKSIDYCKIGEVSFRNPHKVMELESPDTAFKLGLEFGINLSLDAFHSLTKQIFEHANESETTIGKIIIQQLFEKSGIQRKSFLPKDLLHHLKKSKSSR